MDPKLSLHAIFKLRNTVFDDSKSKSRMMVEPRKKTAALMVLTDLVCFYVLLYVNIITLKVKTGQNTTLLLFPFLAEYELRFPPIVIYRAGGGGKGGFPRT